MRPGPRRACAIAKPPPSSPSRFSFGHAHVLPQRLAVPAALGVAEHGQAAHDGDAGRVHRHEDHRLAVVRVGVGVGDAHEHRDLAARVERAAREPLVAVDHVVVAVALDAARDVGGVARRDPRLGHREARADLAVEQRLQPLLLLERRAELGEDLHVAGVGRRAVGRLAEQRRRAHHLAQRRVVEVREPGAVVGLGQEEVPEVALARLGLQLLHHRRREVRVARLGALRAVDRLGRPHDVVVELDELRLQLVGARRWVRSPSRLSSVLRVGGEELDLGFACGSASASTRRRSSSASARSSAVSSRVDVQNSTVMPFGSSA